MFASPEHFFSIGKVAAGRASGVKTSGLVVICFMPTQWLHNMVQSERKFQRQVLLTQLVHTLICNYCMSRHDSCLTSPPTNQHPTFTGRMPYLLSNQQCQSTGGEKYHITYILTASSSALQPCLWPQKPPGYLGDEGCQASHQPSDARTPLMHHKLYTTTYKLHTFLNIGKKRSKSFFQQNEILSKRPALSANK